jgi:hypothetical protein
MYGYPYCSATMSLGYPPGQYIRNPVTGWCLTVAQTPAHHLNVGLIVALALLGLFALVGAFLVGRALAKRGRSRSESVATSSALAASAETSPISPAEPVPVETAFNGSRPMNLGDLV